MTEDGGHFWAQVLATGCGAPAAEIGRADAAPAKAAKAAAKATAEGGNMAPPKNVPKRAKVFRERLQACLHSPSPPTHLAMGPSGVPAKKQYKAEPHL